MPGHRIKVPDYQKKSLIYENKQEEAHKIDNDNVRIRIKLAAVKPTVPSFKNLKKGLWQKRSNKLKTDRNAHSLSYKSLLHKRASLTTS